MDGKECSATMLNKGLSRGIVLLGIGEKTSWPVSRVLSAPPPDQGLENARDDHSSGTLVAERLLQPTRIAGPETDLGRP